MAFASHRCMRLLSYFLPFLCWSWIHFWPQQKYFLSHFTAKCNFSPEHRVPCATAPESITWHDLNYGNHLCVCECWLDICVHMKHEPRAKYGPMKWQYYWNINQFYCVGFCVVVAAATVAVACESCEASLSYRTVAAQPIRRCGAPDRRP